jgi:hypothetical protein
MTDTLAPFRVETAVDFELPLGLDWALESIQFERRERAARDRTIITSGSIGSGRVGGESVTDQEPLP